MKRLHPSTQYLFGDQVKEVSKDIKAADELDPLAPPPKKFKSSQSSLRGGGGAGGSFTRFNRGRGGSNQPRGGKKFPVRGGISKLKE